MWRTLDCGPSADRARRDSRRRCDLCLLNWNFCVRGLHRGSPYEFARRNREDDEVSTDFSGQAAGKLQMGEEFIPN